MNSSTQYQQIGGSRQVTVGRSGWVVAKVVLRCISYILGIAVIGVAIATAVDFQKNYGVPVYSAYYFCVPVSIPVWPLLSSPFQASQNRLSNTGSVVQVIWIMLWDTAELITLCVRKGRGMHPGAHVGIELIHWLMLISVSAVGFAGAVGVGLALGSTSYNYDYGYNYDDNAYDYTYDYTDSDVKALSDYLVKVRVSGGLLSILAYVPPAALAGRQPCRNGLRTNTRLPCRIIRFSLFVRACIETHRRRRGRQFTPPPVVTTQYNPGLAQSSYSVSTYGPTAYNPAPYNPQVAAVPQVTAVPMAPMTPQPYDPIGVMPAAQLAPPPQYYNYQQYGMKY